jgi:hypothetical protein
MDRVLVFGTRGSGFESQSHQTFQHVSSISGLFLPHVRSEGNFFEKVSNLKSMLIVNGKMVEWSKTLCSGRSP